MAKVWTKALALAFILGALSTAAAAQSSDEAADADRVRYTLGLKLWYNNWETWPSERSDTKLAWIPALGVSYGNYFGSFSYFNKTRYSFPVSLGNADRREMDLSVGYWVLQGEGRRLRLSAGYQDGRPKIAG